ncbi:MAG: histidine utilization repressor [Pelagibacterium sp. SCN 63-23]|nr:MAG: histidine utilization repressor [Pelagibacterium sp. SCN 63-23]
MHQRIKRDLESKILSGEWPPGYRLPNELDLMAQYGCARMTVNKVVSGLATAGLVERRRRAGTFVSRQHSDSAVLRIPNLRDEVTARGAAYRYRLLSRTVRMPLESGVNEIEFSRGRDLLELHSLHYADDRPFAFEKRLISLAAVPEAGSVDFADVSGGAWLMDHIPWTEASHRIGALNATAEIARVLRIAVGEAVLSVERHTWRLNDGVTQVWQYFPADLYHLSARFTPNQAPRDEQTETHQQARATH